MIGLLVLRPSPGIRRADPGIRSHRPGRAGLVGSTSPYSRTGGRDIDIPAKKSTLTARDDLAPLRPRWRLSLAVQCLDANVAKNKSGTSTVPLLDLAFPAVFDPLSSAGRRHAWAGWVLTLPPLDRGQILDGPSCSLLGHTQLVERRPSRRHGDQDQPTEEEGKHCQRDPDAAVLEESDLHTGLSSRLYHDQVRHRAEDGEIPRKRRCHREDQPSAVRLPEGWDQRLEEEHGRDVGDEVRQHRGRYREDRWAMQSHGARPGCQILDETGSFDGARQDGQTHEEHEEVPVHVAIDPL